MVPGSEAGSEAGNFHPSPAQFAFISLERGSALEELMHNEQTQGWESEIFRALPLADGAGWAPPVRRAPGSKL